MAKRVQSSPEPIRCDTCGHDAQADGFKIGPVVHCIGSRPRTFGNWITVAHHGRQTVRCPQCARLLGCDGCIVDAADMERVFCLVCDMNAAGDHRGTMGAAKAFFGSVYETFGPRSDFSHPNSQPPIPDSRTR